MPEATPSRRRTRGRGAVHMIVQIACAEPDDDHLPRVVGVRRMKRGLLFLVALASCARPREEPTSRVWLPPDAAVAPVSTAGAAPSVTSRSDASPPDATTALLSTTPPDAEALAELEKIRRAANVCGRKPSDPTCEDARALARSYGLMHCGSDGVDPAYTFAWAAREPLPGATVQTDRDGTKWYVEAARSPRLARVDERLWSEGGWITVEPHLRFETDYPSAEEAKRLLALDAQIKKKTMAEGIVRAVFYEGSFVGAFPFYAALKPQKDGGMLYGFGNAPKAPTLCKSRQARVLSEDLATFAGTWSRLR